MVPRIHAGGKSFSGVVAYLTHDTGTPSERRPKPAERVGLVELENLPECRPATAARIMAGTAREADTLKQLADSQHPRAGSSTSRCTTSACRGLRRNGRSEREMLTAARGSLEALGMGNRQALVVEHTDRAHRHVHVVVNRVSPEDGRAASCSNDARTLSQVGADVGARAGADPLPWPASQRGRAQGTGGAAHPASHRAGRRSGPPPRGAPETESQSQAGARPRRPRRGGVEVPAGGISTMCGGSREPASSRGWG